MPDLPPNFSEEVISTNNSSTANLGAGASFTGVSDQSIDYESVTIILKSDQPCTVQLLQSTDNVNFDIVDTYTTTANIGDARTFDAVSSFAQVIVTNNGGSTTTYLRLQTVFSPTFCTTPRSLTQLGNFRVAVMESVPIGVSGTTGVSGGMSVLNFPVDQLIHGVVGVSGTSAVSGSVFILNFPVTQAVSGFVSILNFPPDQLIHGIVGVSGTTAVSGIIDIGNFPQIQGVSGGVTILNFPPDQLIHGIVGVSGTAGVSGSVSILNFPAIQAVSGSVTILNFPADQLIHGIVGVSGITAVSGTVFQGTNPWLTKDASDGVSGSLAPLNSMVVAGADVSGIVRTLHTDVSGNLNVIFPYPQAVSGSLSILNLPAIQGVSGGVTILNFPAVQGVSGTVNIGNLPVTQGVSGSVSILNFPAVQAVSGTVFQGTNPWLTRDNADGISGTAGPLYSMQMAGADVSGTLRTIHTDVSGNVFANILNFPAVQAVSGNISVNLSPDQLIHGIVGVSGTTAVSGTVFQGTSPWITRDQADGTSGTAVPGFVGIVGGSDVSGIARTFRTDVSGNQFFDLLDGFGNPIGSQNIGGSNFLDVTLAASAISGSAVPSRMILIGGADVSGIARTMRTDVSGNVYADMNDGFGNHITSDNPGTANNQRLHVAVPDTTVASVAFNSVSGTGSVIQITMAGLQSAGFQLAAGTFIGTLIPEASVDGGVNWQSTLFYNPSNQSVANNFVFSSSNTLTILGVVGFPGISHVRVRVSAYTSGTATALLRAAAVTGSAPSTTISAAFATATSTYPAVSAGTVTQIIAANSNRKYLAIANNGNQTAHIQFGTGTGLTATTGLPIASVSFYEFKGDNLYTGPVFIIVSGTIAITVTEGTP